MIGYMEDIFIFSGLILLVITTFLISKVIEIILFTIFSRHPPKEIGGE